MGNKQAQISKIPAAAGSASGGIQNQLDPDFRQDDGCD